MKKIITAVALLWFSIAASAQVVNNNNNTNGTSLPVSNATLPSTVSNSNNSNSGVNPNGNPGTILNSNTNSASAGFQTPAPPLEPGTKLTSGGSNVLIPGAPNSITLRDSNRFVLPVVKDNAAPKLTDEQRKAHIDSMVRAIDRRQEAVNKPITQPALKKSKKRN